LIVVLQMTIEAVALTQKLVRFDTINPPGNELECAVYLGDLLREGGLEVELVPFAPHRANLIARVGAPDRPTLCFTGHLDTVPLGTVPWSVDPHGGAIVDGRLHGRGSSDMKAGIAAFTAAALSCAAAFRDGSAGLSLILTVGEETGCEGALNLAKAHAGRIGRVDALVVAEPTANRLLLGHKGVLWVRAETKGVTAHGSSPHLGTNAIHKAADLVQRLRRFSDGNPAHPVMGGLTLNVGTIAGGINVNSVPDHAEVGIDLRTVPGTSHAVLRQALQTALGDDLDRLVDIVDLPGVWTDPDKPWIRAVSDAVERVTRVQQMPAAAAYFTDGSALVPAFGTPPAVVLGPGNPDLAHKTDEYCDVAKIIEAQEIFRELMVYWQQHNMQRGQQ
jgi:succinyl-diaminopimelate desuccinylase